ncbi:MAG: hypothetical protein FWF31_08210 [Desulfobulbus sp.]|nr:hypothetical protein [Desulfobulbus sp.]
MAEQEKLAEAFVACINEGKAPFVELRPMFQRFRIWLQKLYRALSGQVAINDEVRVVFDRMLATDQEMADTAARNELLSWPRNWTALALPAQPGTQRPD